MSWNASAAGDSSGAMNAATSRSTPRRGVLVDALATLRLWRERRRSRLALLDLTPELLRDVGLSREDVVREAVKPFWLE